MAAKAPRAPTHHIVSVVGTRPEAIKMAPVLSALASRAGFDQRLVLTGQHRGLARGLNMLPDSAVVDLAVDPAELSAGELCEQLHERLCGLLPRLAPDLVLVHGDTTSALAGALAARDCGIALGHVEAGLRSFDLDQPWPEEANRVRIDALSDLLFAPTEHAAANLAAEPQVRGEVFVTGNTGIDALFRLRSGSAPPPSAGARRQLLVTCHRRENRGEPLRRICAALREMAATLPVDIVLPLHLNSRLHDEVARLLGGAPHIRLVEPLSHAAMVALLEQSWAVLTDSGGLQEEGAALGRPVLVLREVTERGEASANLELVGTDPRRIVAAVAALLADETRYARMSAPSPAFGDGGAGLRIADAIAARLGSAMRAVPA